MSKKPTGRPPRYKTPEELAAKIDEYFKHCERGRKTILTDRRRIPITKDLKPQYYTQRIPPTMEGLARYLGFFSLSSLWRYGQKPTGDDDPELTDEQKQINIRFRNILMGAKLDINQGYVERSTLGEYDSKIAALVLATHAGYNRKLELTGKDGGPINTQNYTAYPSKPMSLAEWQKQVKAISDPPKKPAKKRSLKGKKLVPKGG